MALCRYGSRRGSQACALSWLSPGKTRAPSRRMTAARQLAPSCGAIVAPLPETQSPDRRFSTACGLGRIAGYPTNPPASRQSPNVRARAAARSETTHGRVSTVRSRRVPRSRPKLSKFQRWAYAGVSVARKLCEGRPAAANARVDALPMVVTSRPGRLGDALAATIIDEFYRHIKRSPALSRRANDLALQR